MAEESKKQEHHHQSWKDKFLHHDPAHGKQEDGKNKTSASAMKTEDSPDIGEGGKKKKESLWQKYEHHVAKDNQKQGSDNIWSGYRGPGH